MQSHQAGFGEFPILVVVAAKPIAAVIVPFIGETNRDAVLAKRLHLLDEPVIEFTLPFAGQEGFDLCAVR